MTNPTSPIDSPRERLFTALTPVGHDIIGCHRRNLWHAELIHSPSWRFIEGNAFLAQLADRREIPLPSPLPPISTYLMNGRHLLRYHGGTWGYWVVNDALDHWSLISSSHAPLSSTIFIVHANSGTLDVKVIDIPPTLDPAERTSALLASYCSSPPGRIPKSGARAARSCKWCHFKQRCDAYDTLHDERGDWSADYPIP